MSMIVPAGINKLNWSPKDKETTTVKTAGADEESTQEVVVEEDVDALEAAARSFLDQKEAAPEEAEEVKEASEETEEVKEASEETEVKEAGTCGCEAGQTCEACGGLVAEDEIEAPVGEEEAAEVVEVADEGEVHEEAEEVAIESVEVAVETAAEALEDAAEAIAEVKGVTVDEGAEEVPEGPVDDEVVEVSEIEIEVPGVMEEDEDVEVEKEGGLGCMMSDESGEEKTAEEDSEKEPTVADSSEEFCKFAKLSPQNRSKIADYWVNMLGYPKDYVALLTKDYEK